MSQYQGQFRTLTITTGDTAKQLYTGSPDLRYADVNIQIIANPGSTIFFGDAATVTAAVQGSTTDPCNTAGIGWIAISVPLSGFDPASFWVKSFTNGAGGIAIVTASGVLL